jgi:hypothetical protein
MAGLIKDAMQEAPVEPMAEEQPAVTPEDEGEPASPEEQEAYSRVVAAGGKVLYGKESSDQFLAMLKAGADDPAKALADATAMLIVQLDKKANGTIPDVVIIPAAAELLGLTAELAEKAGIFEVDDAVKAKASQQLILSLSKEYEVDPAELQALIAEIGPERSKQMAAEQGRFGGYEKAEPMPAEV